MSVLPGSNSGAASEATFALTGAQLGIWNAQRLDPESRSYLVGEVLEISGDEPIDTELLTAAITATIGEAETMRLRMIETAGEQNRAGRIKARVSGPAAEWLGADPIGWREAMA